MLSTRWTKEQEEELLRRIEAGETVMRVARSMGRTEQALRTKLYALKKRRAGT